MRKKVLAILGLLLVAVSASQIETVAALSVRKDTRASHPETQQHRDAFKSVNWSSTVQSGHSNHSVRHGPSASTAVESKSCDIFWCYEN